MSRHARRSNNRNPRLHAIDALIEQGHFAEAEAQARQLLEQDPESGEALGILGLALTNQARYKEALPLLEKAHALAPELGAVAATLGLCLYAERRYPAAIALLEKTLSAEPYRLSAWLSLGNAYLRAGKPGRAQECYAEYVRRDPLNASANYSLSSFITYEADDPIFTQLPPLLDRPRTSTKDKAILCFTLGKAYWDIGNTEQAFDYYHRANTYTRDYKGSDHLPETGQVELITQMFTPERFHTLQAGGLNVTPQIFIAGHSRSGKSLVETLLTGVEDIICDGESFHLGNYIKQIEKTRGRLATYLEHLTPEQCFADAQGYLRFIEFDGRPRTATRPLDIWALGLIGLWFPTAPIVFCQRNLFDLGTSAYFNHYTEGNDHTEDLYTLGEHIAYYELAMQHWARVLPNPIHWVSYEELVADPQGIAERLRKAFGKPGGLTAEFERKALQYSDYAKHLSPGRSLDVPMPIRKDFVGMSEPFQHHLQPLYQGYRDAMEAKGLPAQPVENFDWQLQGRVVALDNSARLPREENFLDLMATNAFAVVAFDPTSQVAADSVAGIEEFQLVPHAVLGDGQPATLYATLDESMSSVLAPLPADKLPEPLRNDAQVLAQLPISTLRLDDIDGLTSLDWLLLDELCDAMAVLENGVKALENTLLLQVTLAFEPTHERQPNFTEISHWASRHGFTFYRFNNPVHRSLMPERADIVQPQATHLVTADALFIPAPDRLAQLDKVKRQRLAFLLDAVFGIHDLPYQLLAEEDSAQAECYLKARGYVGGHRLSEAASLPMLFSVRQPQRAAERGLAAAIANHNIHRAVGLAQQLLKEYPNDAEGRYYLGQALSHLGQHEQALTQLAPLYDETSELRYGLALAWAQSRSGRDKAARHTFKRLAEHFPEHLAVIRLGLELKQSSRQRQELVEALADCEQLLGYENSALVAAGLGDTASARADLLGVKAALELALAQTLVDRLKACQTGQEALTTLKDRQGPLRARLLIVLAEAQHQLGELSDAITTLWQACATYPYSLATVEAYKKLRDTLAHSPVEAHQQLAQLHQQVQKIWQGYQGEQLQYSFGDFGLPYQGFEPLMLPGTRSAKLRLSHYRLEDLLPDGATALDIGCNHGFLLLGLADQLSAGEGFDISKACVEVGNAVAQHLGHSHIKLYQKPFDDFVGKKAYDLVIACAVHQWIGKPLEDFGTSLFALCKPGGIVLLESQGARDQQHTEPGFSDNATAIASAGFEIILKGSLCDDALNYREFWLLQRPKSAESKQPAAKQRRSMPSGQGGHLMPAMEGSAAALEPMRAICRTLLDHGAWFNPDLRLRAEDNNLALFGTPGASRASYLRVPMALMPQLECFDITARQGKLVAEPNGTPLLAHQHEMMEAMFELYNATHKLDLWRESLPFLAWRETPQVLEYLLKARPLNSNLARCQNLFKSGEHEQLLVESFLNSRKFGVTPEQLKALGVKGEVAQRHVLLSFVDCLNHRLSAEGFTTPLVGGKPSVRTFHVPDMETGELFVRYNLYDPVDTTLSYGFMDAASHWLTSIPLTLSVSGQTIQVQGLPMRLEGPLPASFEDLRSYMPAIQRQGERHISVTKLMLCTENPSSLRRVLTWLVFQAGIAHTDYVARQQVAELERQLLDGNQAWWEKFERLTQPLLDTHMAKQLCHHALNIVRTCRDALGNL